MKNKLSKILLMLLCFTMAFNTVFAADISTEVKYSQKIANPNFDMPMSGDRILIDGYAIIEAEDIVLDTDKWIVEKDASASGGARIRLHDSVAAVTNHADIESPELGTNIYVPYEGVYNVWIRAYPRKSWNRQIFMSVDGESYTGYLIRTYENWYWINLGSHPLDAGLNQLLFKHRDNGFIADKIIITADQDFVPEGANDIPNPTGPVDIGSLYETPPVTPPDSHPRLLLTPETIPTVKENIKHPYFADAYSELLANAKRPMNASLPAEYSGASNRDASLYDRMLARAFLYALGEADASVAKETIAALRTMLDTFKANANGNNADEIVAPMLKNAACVYDWCYDQMTEEDKAHIVDKLLKWMRQIGYPMLPDEYNGVDGKSGEDRVMRGPISAAIAIYDEKPDPYLAYVGMLFAQYVEPREFYHQSGRYIAGTHYFFRGLMDCYVARIFDLWGYKDIFGENLKTIPYIYLQQRLPNGYMFKENDDGAYSYGTGYAYKEYASYMPYAAGYTNDPLITGEYARQVYVASNDYSTSIERLIFVDPTIEAKMPSDGDFSLVAKYNYPLSALVTRTGWNLGMDSDTAMVQINMRNIAPSGHMHLDIGSFQVYYKGALAIDSGNYFGKTDSWGSEYDYNYHKRTVAHNCITVYNPDEEFNSYWLWEKRSNGDNETKMTNDGGQRFTYTGSVPSWTEIREELNVTKSCYVGPNEKTPKFAYIRGNLTNAYTDKITDYERAFVYMDLFNDDYPIALMVYDKVDTAKADYPTKYLLHTQEEPVVDESTKTVTVTKTKNPGDNGKMVHKTLLPSNAKIDLIGGPGKEYWVSDADGNLPTELKDGNKEYGLEGNWRAEISYPKERKDHTFLNCMYVTDYERNLPELDMISESQGNFVGVTVMDRTALIRNSTDLQAESFSVTLRDNGYQTASMFVADVAAGVWNVKGIGVDINVEVKDGENCIYFEAAPGVYEISPAAEGSTVNDIEYAEREISVPGDYYIYSDKLFWNTPYPSKLIDGVPYFDAVTVFNKIGAEVTDYADGSIGAALDGRTATVAGNASEYTLNGETVALAHPTKLIDGRIYISNDSCNDFMQAQFEWHPYEKILEYMTYDDPRVVSKQYSVALSAFDRSNVITPVSATSSNNYGSNIAENSFDFDLTTHWVSYDKNAWVMLDLGSVVDFSKIYVGIPYGSRRVNYFSIEISEDGKRWENIFTGESKGGTLNPEIVFEGAKKARYVRYVGNDNSEKSGMNCVSEIIVMK